MRIFCLFSCKLKNVMGLRQPVATQCVVLAKRIFAHFFAVNLWKKYVLQGGQHRKRRLFLSFSFTQWLHRNQCIKCTVQCLNVYILFLKFLASLARRSLLNSIFIFHNLFFFLIISIFLPLSFWLSLFSLFVFLPFLFVPHFFTHLPPVSLLLSLHFVFLFVVVSQSLFLTEEMQLPVSVCGQYTVDAIYSRALLWGSVESRPRSSAQKSYPNMTA